jgi:hypothetical protein
MTTDVIAENKHYLVIEAVHRGVPPTNCRMGCPEWMTLVNPSEVCKTCVQRPIKGIDTRKIEVM